MVELYDYDHIYTVAPPLWFNQSGEVRVRMKVAAQLEVEAQARLEAQLEVEARTKKAQEFIASKVIEIEGLKVGGKEIKTFAELRQSGPNELIKWITLAVFSTQVLSEAEIKN